MVCKFSQLYVLGLDLAHVFYVFLQLLRQKDAPLRRHA